MNNPIKALLTVGLILGVVLEIINLRTAYWNSVSAKAEGEAKSAKALPIPGMNMPEGADNERHRAIAKRLAEIQTEKAALKKKLSELEINQSNGK